MRFADLSEKQLLQMAREEGLRYRIGPFNIELKTNISDLALLFAKIYAPLPVLTDDVVFDYHLQINRPLGVRRWWHPQATFHVDGVTPFDPYPLSHAFPLSEWGLNWCIGLSSHQYLLLHSAVVEYNGKALIMPALPGSGKSTLCTGLMLRGWRLLSDEFGLIDYKTNRLLPLPRAIPLKNESISVIRDFSSEVYLGPVFPGTRKGDVAHVAPTELSIENQSRESTAALVVFPRYNPDIKCKLEKKLKSQAFTSLTSNSFNYHLSQEQGFDTLAKVVQQCDSYTLQFNDMDAAIDVLTELMEEKSICSL